PDCLDAKRRRRAWCQGRLRRREAVDRPLTSGPPPNTKVQAIRPKQSHLAINLMVATRSHSWVRLAGWGSVGPRLDRDRRINPTRNPPSSANLNHMVGYAWTNSLRSLSPMATLTIPLECEAMDWSRIVPAPACASAPTDRAPARGCDGTPPPPPR